MIKSIIITATMSTYLEPGTFNFTTPAQHEPITTHRKKKSQPRRGDGPPVKIVSSADPPCGASRPILNVPAELLVEIIGYGSQSDKLSWMLACQKFVDPAERALWRVCGRKGFFKLMRMDEEKRERFVKMISHLHVGDDLSSLSSEIARPRSRDVQHGIYPDHIPMLPASWFIHSRLRSFTALSGGWGNNAIDDVFAALRQASTLEVTQINYHIERCTPTAFPWLLLCLPRLRVFEARHGSSDAYLPFLAEMPTIKDIALGGTLEPSIVRHALDIPGAFINLEALDIAVSLDAATNLLQHLSRLNLKRLWVILERNYNLSDEERADASISSLQAIGAISSLTLLHLKFEYLDLPNELEPLKQLLSLRTFRLMLEPYNMNGPRPEDYSTEIVELLRHLPLEEFSCYLNFDTAALESLGKACPRLRTLRFSRWLDLDALDTSSPPMFPALEYIGISNFRLDEHPMYSKKCIKTWAMKLAVAGPVLTNFSMFPVFIGFKKQGGVRRWFASHYDWEEDTSTFMQDFDSHKGVTRKNRKRG
ncbi:hypothetical protein KCU76_g2059, partial [Aureobasidium melanogenum]